MVNMIYLASPYTHPDEGIEEERAKLITKVAARLFEAGHQVFSPIAHGHPIAKESSNLPTDAAFWEDYNYWFLDKCSEVWVIDMEGWETSKGVTAEVMRALEKRIPISRKSVHLILNDEFC